MALVDQVTAGLTALSGRVKTLSTVLKGGTAGQVLTKSSATDYATSWAVPFTTAAIYPPASGWWAQADGILTLTPGALTSGRLTLHPFPVAPGTYDAIGLNVTTAQSSDGSVTCTIGIYGSDANGNPDTTNLIRSGTATLTALGMRPAVFGYSWAVAAPMKCWAGPLYVAATAPGTPAQIRMISNCTYPMPVSDATGIGARPRGWQRTGLSALPTDAFGTTSWTVSTASDVPTIGLRRS